MIIGIGELRDIIKGIDVITSGNSPQYISSGSKRFCIITEYYPVLYCTVLTKERIKLVIKGIKIIKRNSFKIDYFKLKNVLSKIETLGTENKSDAVERWYNEKVED